MVKFIRDRVLSGEFMAGAWCNLGSSLTAEMAARTDIQYVHCMGSTAERALVYRMHHMTIMATHMTNPMLKVTSTDGAGLL